MEHSARMPEIQAVYSHFVYGQNARIYGPKVMYSCILSSCDSILVTILVIMFWNLNNVLVQVGLATSKTKLDI